MMGKKKQWPRILEYNIHIRKIYIYFIDFCTSGVKHVYWEDMFDSTPSYVL